MRIGMWFYLLFLLIGSIAVVNAQSETKLTDRLRTSITQKGEEAELKAWIFFTDKGTNIETKLVEAETGLTPRARKRRLRNRGRNNLVDFKDIPVHPGYIRWVQRYVNKVHHKSRWLNAISVYASGKELKHIENLPFVKRIDKVMSAKLPQPQPESMAPHGMPENITTLLDYGASYDQNNQINTIPLHDMGYDGSGVVVCMLDAGFNNLTHEALDHLNILHSWDFVNGDSIVWDEPGQAGTGNHGTYTLSTLGGYEPGQLIGPAYGASFLLGKTENTDWERHVEEDDWVAGAEWADSLGADVISSSLGYRDFDPGEGSYTSQDMDGNTAISTIGADIAASRGILVVTSAGNEGPASPPENSIVAPTDGDSVLSIGAVDASGSRAGFSSMGPTADGRIKPNVMARGVSTYCALPSGPSSYGGVSGTSLSCPLVAGAAALVMQVNPHLTNMQVYRALELTASNAASPNNSYGWGIINTFDAAFYYTPQIVHTPLPDTEELTGPYPVQAEIISNFSLIGDSIRVYYRIGAGPFQSVVMNAMGGNMYEGDIPGTGVPATVSYYIKAVSDSGVATLPAMAPADVFQFTVGADVTAPVINHSPLGNTALLLWPPGVQAIITDNTGVNDNSVHVEWKLNGTAQSNFSLIRVQGDLFKGAFNLDVSQVNAGDVVEYRIYAEDIASTPNSIYHPEQGFHQFEVLDARGVVLLLNDVTTVFGKIESRGKVFEYEPSRGTHSVSQMQNYLQELNFLVTVEDANTSDPSSWGQYNVLISASGENPEPVSNAQLRQNLIQYVQDGGKLLVEGGEIGYDAISSPGYPNFASQVLHGTNWNGDDEGPLILIGSQQNHPLATMPNILPNSMALDYNSPNSWYDQDAITPDNQSYLIYQAQQQPGDAGILIYDDNPYPESAQIVYYAFDFSSLIDTVAAKNLLENTMVYLMNDDTPVGIEEKTGHPISTLELYPAYPNPFNPATTIRFNLPEDGEVTLTVYNNLGQGVATLINGHRKAGQHKVLWDASDFASGVYYLMLKGAEGQKVQKLLLLK